MTLYQVYSIIKPSQPHPAKAMLWGGAGGGVKRQWDKRLSLSLPNGTCRALTGVPHMNENRDKNQCPMPNY
jgi:hypothetical protein